MQKTAPSLPIVSLLLALSVSLVWGFNFIVVKTGLLEIPPITLCFLRFFFASIPGIFFVPKPQAPWKYIISYGLITFALQFALLFGGMAVGAAPGIAAIITQSQVFFAIFFAYLFAGQAINRWQMMGALISFSGIVLIAVHHDTTCTLFALTLLLSGALVWGFGNVISIRLKDVNMLSLVIWSSFIAILPTLAVAFLFEQPMQTISHFNHLHLLTILSVAYITYLSTHFGYGIWSWLFSKYPIASIAPFALLSPIVAMLSSSLLLDESFESWKITAAFLVILGLVLNVFGQRVFYWLTHANTVSTSEKTHEIETKLTLDAGE